MSDSTNTVTGGEYELVAVLFDQIDSKPGEPFAFTRYRAGDIVTLDVEEARRLIEAGAVVAPGARQKAAAEAARIAYEAALAALPDDVRAELLAGDVTNVGPTAPAAPPAMDRPANSAKKPVWVAYAKSRGLSEAEVNKLTKDELIARLEVGDNADPADPGTDGGQSGSDPDSGQGDSGEGDGDPDAPKPLPLVTAPIDEWIEAAVERGLERNEVEQYTADTKQELIDLLT